MKKTYTVESTFNDMRLDRWIRNVLGNIPQGLIEKNLRSGKIKLNKKKIKSSVKVKTRQLFTKKEDIGKNSHLDRGLKNVREQR